MKKKIDKLDFGIRIRFTTEEAQVMKEIAASQGIGRATWIRETIRGIIKDERRMETHNRD